MTPDYQEMLKITDDVLTNTQRDQVKAFLAHDCSPARAAKAVGLSRAAIRQSVKAMEKKAANLGYSPAVDMDKPTVAPFRVRGTSTLYDADGNKSIQWVKTERDKAAFLEEVRDTIHDIISDLPKIKPTKTQPKSINESIHAFYPLGDPHIGMLTWGEETGRDWDLSIAERVYAQVWERLVRSAPRAAECTIIDLGDFWHADNLEGRTSRSGHRVDQDGRYAKMIKVGYRILMQMIQVALQHHGLVNVKILPGNHDDVGSLFLRESLEWIYQDEPRVKVDPSVSSFQYTQWGKCLVGYHHGHECSMKDLPMVMASDHAAWSDCRHRYWYTGHIHHDSSLKMTGKEYQGCKVESFRVIVPNEAYAHNAGYRSGRDAKVMLLHKERGEIARFTQDVEYVEDQIDS